MRLRFVEPVLPQLQQILLAPAYFQGRIFAAVTFGRSAALAAGFQTCMWTSARSQRLPGSAARLLPACSP
jgi:hypothetical protein